MEHLDTHLADPLPEKRSEIGAARDLGPKQTSGRCKKTQTMYKAADLLPPALEGVAGPYQVSQGPLRVGLGRLGLAFICWNFG